MQPLLSRFRSMPLSLHRAAGCLALAALPMAASAKLPAPSDEAKAAAEITKAKTAHAGKVDNFKLCQAANRVASQYQADLKKAGKPATSPVSTPACEDPGPFVAPSVAAVPAPALAAKAAAKP